MRGSSMTAPDSASQPHVVNESKGADLLVVGNRGHGAFHGMLLGSVSIHCVTNATCPVVVVRSTS
jgi:nucleotide-binding universal stress UspA family protein